MNEQMIAHNLCEYNGYLLSQNNMNMKIMH